MSYIQNINIEKILHLENINIELPNTENLIITGKNGSGKTILLEELKNKLSPTSRTRQNSYDSELSISLQETENESLYSYFPASRQSRMIDPKKGQEPDDMDRDTGLEIDKDPSRWFVKYIVDMYQKRTDAYHKWKEEGIDIEENSYLAYKDWFQKLEKSLNIIFDDTSIKLEYNRDKKNFEILEEGKQPYTLNQLSSGYSAIINIISNLILKMNKDTNTNFDVEGVVLIDEVETHLHVSLQKVILPFLESFFPNIQFIVTTHSPFILTLIKDTVIFDLENKIQVEDLSSHSYSSIVESYFNTDEYSKLMKKKYYRYIELKESKLYKNSDAETELHDLKKYFKSIPTEWAEDMKLAFLLEENS